MDNLTPQEKLLLEQIELMLRQNVSLEEATNKLNVMTVDPDLVTRVIEYRRQLVEQKRTVTLNTALIDAEDVPDPWYTGPSPLDIYWPALKSLLEEDPGWKLAVPSIDSASTDIVGLLADPHTPQIRTRGLVLGYIQSGKTANFTATIAKAADAGYRMFIVLSGVHNALRRQTQLRLERQLQALQPSRWLLLTDEQADFGNPVKALPLVKGTDLRLLAVVKKNTSRLTRLRDWLYQAHEQQGLETCPVLLIDDESDQASPNTHRNPELDRTKINQRLVELLRLPRVAYIGYTATPFANVLINPADREDMYPRDFIYPLEKPDGYFGTEELFGLGDFADAETLDDVVEHDMVRIVPDEESEEFDAHSRGQAPATITPALEIAVRWFILATAARRVRSAERRHSSMLVHTTLRIGPQLELVDVLSEWIRELRAELVTKDLATWRELWETESALEPADRHGLMPVPFEAIVEMLIPVLNDVRVLADNSASVERLIYSDEPATVIAVGGNTLSRGLTLEGLVSSFFLRNAATYDSLLQMGRWFGYRPGYADLPRVWTTRDLAQDFRFLSEVERELRSEIRRYRHDGVRPIDLPVRIQLHPRMKPTAASKMRFSVPAAASFSNQHPQTTYFRHRDIDAIRTNWDAAVQLASGRTWSSGTPSKRVEREVPVADILRFIESYSFDPRSEMNGPLLTSYIKGQNDAGALLKWNVVVITKPQTDKRKMTSFGPLREVGLLTRSKLNGSSEPSSANIGTLMSRPDRVADLADSGEVVDVTDEFLRTMRNEAGTGLLLLYPIDKTSTPRKQSRIRSRLDAVDHLLGAAFDFPRAADGTEPSDYIQVDTALLAAGQYPEEPEEEYSDVDGDHDEVDLGV